jgi:hypothetical protein
MDIIDELTIDGAIGEGGTAGSKGAAQAQLVARRAPWMGGHGCSTVCLLGVITTSANE